MCSGSGYINIFQIITNMEIGFPLTFSLEDWLHCKPCYNCSQMKGQIDLSDMTFSLPFLFVLAFYKPGLLVDFHYTDLSELLLPIWTNPTK